jgi:hypothetical protein
MSNSLLTISAEFCSTQGPPSIQMEDSNLRDVCKHRALARRQCEISIGFQQHHSLHQQANRCWALFSLWPDVVAKSTRPHRFTNLVPSSVELGTCGDSQDAPVWGPLTQSGQQHCSESVVSERSLRKRWLRRVEVLQLTYDSMWAEFVLLQPTFQSPKP